ncbi:exodeoxyribonuclease V subunit gamma, partial [Myxococcota bacterium]|nr:exodeoxyribonuclease V subunit gamma [Myxococcota bacterium]
VSELSTIFWEYVSDRWEMLLAWKSGKTFLNPDESPFLIETEAWQKTLFHRLFGHNGIRDSLAIKGNRWILPLEFPSLPMEDRPSGQHIHFFAMAGFPRSWHHLIASLSETNSCTVYYLNPSREYWEDSTRRKSQIEESDENNLLSLWGRTGATDLSFLSALSEYNDEMYFEPHDSQTLLSRLQDNILQNRQPADDPDREAPAQTDTSLKIIAAPSLERECEILTNEIWDIIRSDDSLKFNDIAIIIADHSRLESYETTLGSHLERASIPFQNNPDKGAQTQRLLTVLENLLELPVSSLDRKIMLALLDNPLTGGAFHENRDRWLALVDALAIFSEGEPGKTGRKIHSWDHGIARLVRGALAPPDGSALRNLPGEIPWGFPPVENVTPEEVAPVITRIRSFYDDARYIRQSRLSLARWTRLISQYFSSYIRLSSPAHKRIFQKVTSMLGNLEREVEALSLTPSTMGFEIPRILVQSRLSSLKSATYGYGARGVSISTFPALRPIPFPWVFVVGLSDGVFPRRDNCSILDLTPHTREPGELSQSDHDQYCFLETLSHTKNGLRLSYVAKEAATGRELDPSGLLLTLAREISRLTGASLTGARSQGESLWTNLQKINIFHIHPDQRHHPGYFSPSGFAPSWSEKVYMEYLASQGEFPAEKRAPPVKSPTPAPRESRTLSLWALRRYCSNPMQGSLLVSLGISEENLQIPRFQENDAFLMSRRQRKLFLRESLYEHFSQKNPMDLEALFHHNIAQGVATGSYPADFFSGPALKEDLALLKSYENQFKEIIPSSRLSLWALSRRRSSLEQLITPPQIGESLLTGSLWPVVVENSLVIHMPLGTDILLTQWLNGYLAGMVAIWLGILTEPHFTVALVMEKSLKKKRFVSPGPETAGEWLRHLIGSLEDADNQYNLPMNRILEGIFLSEEEESLTRRLSQPAFFEPYDNRTPLEWASQIPIHPHPIQRALYLFSGSGFSFFKDFMEEQ